MMEENSSAISFNEQFQRALHLPERTRDEKLAKFHCLNQINSDFVHTATTYGK